MLAPRLRSVPRREAQSIEVSILTQVLNKVPKAHWTELRQFDLEILIPTVAKMKELKVVETAAYRWSTIKRGPTGWAQKADIKDLEDAVTKAKIAYYNSDEPLLTDKEFDLIEDVLRERKPKSKALTTGAPIHSLNKVELPYSMGSQNKIKTSEQLDHWVSKNPTKSYVVSDKLDGISFLYVGRKLYTRGDGTYGKDISAFIPHIKGLPKVGPKIAVRGELIMSRQKFDAAWSKLFANARNLVAGVTNRKDIHEALGHVDAVAYELIDGGTIEQQLVKLKALGFRVVPYTVVPELEYTDLVQTLLKRKSNSPYEIDGLVVCRNDKVVRNTTGNPDFSFAFKSEQAMDRTVTEVVAVHWSPSRQGLLKPRVELKPVKLSGVTVTFATGHNAQYIWDNKIGPGAQVQVSRSGDVIPFLENVVKKARKPQMPDVDFEWKGVDVVQTEDSDETNIKAIEHFFVTMGVDGLRYGSVARLYNEGYTEIEEILHADESDLVAVLGRNGSKIWSSIQDIFENPRELPVIMAASGIFSGLAYEKFKKLVQTIPDIMYISKSEALKRLDSVPTWASATINEFVTNFPRFKRWFKRTSLEYSEIEVINVVSKRLNQQIVLFTGFRDQSLADSVLANGGLLSSGMNKKVTLLVAPAGTSNNKTALAEELNVPIMTPEDFRRKFKL